MAKTYSVATVKALKEQVVKANLKRPVRITHYENGDELTYQVKSVASSVEAKVRVQIKRFVGGGFAGQVYQVEVLDIDAGDQQFTDMQEHGVYAMKILIPPSNFSRVFRDTLYWIGFQGPFQLQVNPAAARSGAIWQKFIRRAAHLRFNDEHSVVDIFATFVDHTLGSCGEFSEWINGRTWQLEVDDRMDRLRKWAMGRDIDESMLGSPEYRAKYAFMRDFVILLHDIGAHEFARQYEWSTCKSQPNCLKRYDAGDDPGAGLTAVDFRAGLVLLLFLPMSPGDFKLIIKGLARGSLVQFDRGNINKLRSFVQQHKDHFEDMIPLLDELQEAETTYRNSIIDITHNHLRLLYSTKLWRTIQQSTVQSWHVQNLLDDKTRSGLAGSSIRTMGFALVGAVGYLGKALALTGIVLLLIIMARLISGTDTFSWSVLGASVFIILDGLVLSGVCRVSRKIAGRSDWRDHYKRLITQPDYFKRALRARAAEKLITWHCSGRINEHKARVLLDQPVRFIGYLILSFLPAGLHRILTDADYTREFLANIFLRPFRLYFNADLREQWLRDMVSDGQRKHILTQEDADTILGQIKEPYIQKYLVSLVVHLMTLPVTQVVSLLVALVFYLNHPDMDPVERGLKVSGILVLFQIIPISPGSFCRGIYVVYLVIKERDYKNYNIAVFLGFFKYIGYLAFPIQMAYRYTAMARFMAGHWATEAVHIVPVFGEHGALLEHWVFNLFYNWPLTLRGRMARRAEMRKNQKPRYWHIGICVLFSACILAFADKISISSLNTIPTLSHIWWAVLGASVLCGAGVTLAAAGASMGKRIVSAACSGLLLGAVYTGISHWIAVSGNISFEHIITSCIWRLFALTVFTTVFALLTEIFWPETEVESK